MLSIINILMCSTHTSYRGSCGLHKFNRFFSEKRFLPFYLLVWIISSSGNHVWISANSFYINSNNFFFFFKIKIYEFWNISSYLTVSGLHARIQKKQGNLLVTDLDSTNGTFIDEKRLRPGVVSTASTGSRIIFGITFLTKSYLLIIHISLGKTFSCSSFFWIDKL